MRRLTGAEAKTLAEKLKDTTLDAVSTADELFGESEWGSGVEMEEALNKAGAFLCVTCGYWGDREVFTIDSGGEECDDCFVEAEDEDFTDEEYEEYEEYEDEEDDEED